jgi:hypothetical protein
MFPDPPFPSFCVPNTSQVTRHPSLSSNNHTFISAVRFMEGAPARPWWHYTAERKKKFPALQPRRRFAKAGPPSRNIATARPEEMSSACVCPSLARP